MSINSKYRFMLFCQEYNDVCISTNIILQEYVKNNKDNIDMEIEIEIIDEQIDNVKFKRYKILGVPTLLILKNERIVKRWLDELSYDKLDDVIRGTFNM
jgi:thiol-disulfide isomerase/thioredoxin